MVSKVTQAMVTEAVAAFVKVHGRRPAAMHLMQMLKCGARTLKVLDVGVMEGVKPSAEMVARAREVQVKTAAQVREGRARAGKVSRKAKKESLEERLDRIAREKKGGKTVDESPRWGGGAVRAWRVG